MKMSRHKAIVAGVAAALVTIALRFAAPYVAGIEAPGDEAFVQASTSLVQYLIEAVLAGGIVALGVERTPNKLLSQPDQEEDAL